LSGHSASAGWRALIVRLKPDATDAVKLTVRLKPDATTSVWCPALAALRRSSGLA
jgi:hypothetical protein